MTEKKTVLYNLLTESKTSELFSRKLKCLPSVKKAYNYATDKSINTGHSLNKHKATNPTSCVNKHIWNICILKN